MSDCNFLDLVGKRTLFLGDVDMGKTRLTSRLIEEAVMFYLAPSENRKVTDASKEIRIMVIDLGPNLQMPTGKKIGRRLSLSDFVMSKIHYLTPKELHAPRMAGKTREEIISLAERNVSAINDVLDYISLYKAESLQTVFVNDITLYFHRGSADRMIALAKTPSTFIANGYKGKSLVEDKGSGISRKESVELERFATSMDTVINL